MGSAGVNVRSFRDWFRLVWGVFSSLSHRMFGHANHKLYQAIKVWIIEVAQDAISLTVAGAILGFLDLDKS